MSPHSVKKIKLFIDFINFRKEKFRQPVSIAFSIDSNRAAFVDLKKWPNNSIVPQNPIKPLISLGVVVFNEVVSDLYHSSSDNSAC